jgi:hypothetical protein
MATERPKLFKLYLSGLGTYVYYRAAEAVEAVAAAPGRLVRAIKARLARREDSRKRRWLMTTATLILIAALAAALSLYTEPLLQFGQVAVERGRTLVTTLGQRLRALRRPVVVVVPQQARTVINEKLTMSH